MLKGNGKVITEVQNGLLEAALEYAAARLGWKVFPCKVRDKTPLVKWRDQATVDPEAIRNWWKRWPAANIGVVTGQASGIYVIDADGAEGIEALDRLQALEGVFQDTPVSLTGGGGEHYIFAHPEGTYPNTAARIAKKIDTRGDGGYIVVPPSIHPSGNQYRWMGGRSPHQVIPAALPGWVCNLLNGDSTESPDPVWVDIQKAGTYWLSKALSQAAPGIRNDVGLWLACQLRDAGLSLTDAEGVMAEYARKAPQNGSTYTEREAILTARSAYQRPARDPARGNERVSDSKTGDRVLRIEPKTDSDEINFEDLIPYSVPVPELPKAAQLPEALLSGLDGAGKWLTDYISFASIASPMSPPIFHQALGLALLSTAIARRVYFRVANENIYPNLYILIVANSTLYAKTTAFKVASRVLDLAGLAHLTLPIGITPQSLANELTSKAPDNFSFWEAADQEDWRKERPFAAQRAWLMDEAANLLDAFDQKNTSDLLTYVLKLYDCPDKLKAISTVSRGRQTIRYAYLTICGPTTPSAMRVHLENRDHWGNGLFARFIFVTPDKPPVRIFYPPEIEIPESLTEPLQALALERLPQPRLDSLANPVAADAYKIQLEKGVWERWDAYHNGLWRLVKDKSIPEKLYSNYGRFHVFALKIAMQLAISDWSAERKDKSVTMTLQHWARAQEITEGFRASLHRMVEEANRPSEDDDLERKILKLIRTAYNGASERELAIRLNMTKSAARDELNRTLIRMINDGLVFRGERKGKRGPATNVYLLTPVKNP